MQNKLYPATMWNSLSLYFIWMRLFFSMKSQKIKTTCEVVSRRTILSLMSSVSFSQKKYYLEYCLESRAWFWVLLFSESLGIISSTLWDGGKTPKPVDSNKSDVSFPSLGATLDKYHETDSTSTSCSETTKLHFPQSEINFQVWN